METTSSKINSYLSFKLDDELFAVSVMKVLEVLEKQHITKIPNAPEYIKGVINFRGDVLPVIESREKFNLSPREDFDNMVFIVLDIHNDKHNLMIAVIADQLQDVLEIKQSDIKEVPKMGNNFNTEFIEGMIETERGFMMILNIDKVFTTEDIHLLMENQNLTHIEI